MGIALSNSLNASFAPFFNTPAIASVIQKRSFQAPFFVL